MADRRVTVALRASALKAVLTETAIALEVMETFAGKANIADPQRWVGAILASRGLARMLITAKVQG